jgi:hypothetical protein
MSYFFDSNTTYVIGKRKGNDTNQYNVEYASRNPAPITIEGKRLKELYDVEYWDDYLKLNPNGFKPDDTLTLSKLTMEGREWQAAGMPLSRTAAAATESGNNLADNTAFQAYNQQQSYVKQQSRQIDALNRSNMERINNLEAERTKYIDQQIVDQRKILTLDAENKVLRKEKEFLRAELDAFKEKVGIHIEKAAEAQGLSDGFSMLAQTLGPFIGLGAQWLGQKINGGVAPMQQQQQQLPAQNGVAPAGGGFSTNEQETFQ